MPKEIGETPSEIWRNVRGNGGGNMWEISFTFSHHSQAPSHTDGKTRECRAISARSKMAEALDVAGS